jgi:hypothetical protein
VLVNAARGCRRSVLSYYRAMYALAFRIGLATLVVWTAFAALAAIFV